MALLCYVTDQVQKDATTHGVAKAKVVAFAQEVEKRQSLAGFDHFPPPCLTKKKIFGFNFRLIAAEKRVGEHLVVVLLRLLVRGSSEYGSFLEDPPTWAMRHFSAELDESRLAAWVTERTKKELPAAAAALSDVEKTFLWSSPSSEASFDLMLCETHQWVQAVSETRIADRLIRLPKMILDAAEGPEREVQILRSPDDKNLAILACNLPSMRQCVLLSVSYGERDNQLQAQKAIWSDQLSSADAETVLRHSRRSYLLDVCFLEDKWMAVEKDPQANLALSPEEADILRACDAHASQQCGFPLFINGRAGSGKSTLLQYLFAQCLLRWAGQPAWASAEQTRPLYVASSPELLKVAREVVGSLLKANHEHLLAAHTVDADLLTRTDQCFRDFLRFMRSILSEVKISQFPMSAYVNYTRFRRLWIDRFGREKKAIHEFGPQVSWHVIRGMIKGMSVDDTLAKEDYDELPQDERTISRQVYEAVYDRVWEAWYGLLCRQGKAWDTQDLVRFLLDEGHLPASHVAVFCDEAQDFTRLELEAIYRCCLFSERQIDPLSARRVPFAFAGDPFQTLNPTGFRWESVRAAFTERIMQSLYRCNARAEVPQLNYRELTFNYRSSRRIVHFCNSIQAVRARLFGHRSLSPQSTWQIGEDSGLPVFFETGDMQMEAALREQSDLVLIVPCEEGEEVEYVTKDSYLKSFVQFDDTETPRNVLSAARAKGLEFLRVALYGWSARDEARLLADMMQSHEDHGMTVDQRLALEYFMNNLYVAASRAQRRLFVIDKRESRDSLWWFASDEHHLSHVIRDLPNKESWRQQTGCLIRGVPESFREDRADPRALAEQYEREGRSKEDSYFLKQASQLYSVAEVPAKMHECRALADLFDGRFHDAGEHFDKAGHLEMAIDAYWRGRLYVDIADCAAAHPELAKHPRCRMAAHLHGGSQTLRECRSLCDHLLENASINADLRSDLNSALWKEALQEAVQKSLDSKDRARVELDSGDACALADLLSRLGDLGTQTDSRLLARLLFAARRYQDVLKLLPADDGSELYRDASALSLIAQASSDARQYTAAEARTVADYYFRRKEYTTASRFYRDVRDSDRELECLRRSLQDDSRRGADAALVENALLTLIAGAEWESLISFLTNGQPSLKKQEKWEKRVCTAVLDRIHQDRMIYKIVVPALAHSTELSSADGKVQQQVSEFLAGMLIKIGYAAWRKDLAREVAGAAIERAGRDIDALQFYENWRDSAGSQRDREYAERRWVVCKRRQANRQEREGLEKKANSYRQDAAKVMERYGWTEEAVPDAFPEIETQGSVPSAGREEIRESRPKTTPDSAKTLKDEKTTGDHKGRLGSLSYRVISPKGWINIESDDGLCARVLVRGRTVTSEDVSVKILDAGNAECEQWGLQIRWLSEGEVEFRLGEMECRIVIGQPRRELEEDG
jgi:hypothetical protein